MQLILRFLRPHGRPFAVTAVLLIIDVACALYIPTLAAEILNLGTSGAPMDEIVSTGIQMAVAAVFSGMGAIAGGYSAAVLSARLGRDIRNAVYEKSLKFSMHDFRQIGSSSITTRTVNDITNIQFAFMSFVQMVLPVPIICVIAIVLAFNLDVFGGTALLVVTIAILLLALLIMRQASPIFRRLQKLLDRFSTVFLENVTGVRVVRTFNKQEFEEVRMGESFAAYAKTSIKANRLFANLDGLSFFSVNFFTVFVYFTSGGRIAIGQFHIGDISALISYAMMVLMFIMMAQMVIMTLPRALECCNRVLEVLDYKVEIEDLVTVDPSSRKPSAGEKNVLEFRDVSFRYADAEEDTLHGLTFSCRRGATTAIIGGTGSGKSTIASLIMRFNDVSNGKILLNGVDLRDMTQHYPREHIGYVQQKAWLFSGTIADNLRYGRADATDEELWHALEVAQAADFVSGLDKGLASPVAQGGSNFSGGQKQRLSIARALVARPELYVFDDSFSALDFKTDAALRHALESETRDAAVLIIAQRVSTIAHAEQIVVIDEGGMAGVGTHEELLESCPVYQEIVKSQTKKENE